MPAMNVLANLFVTIYNTEARRKSECVVLPTSKIGKDALSTLKEHGYIKDYERIEDNRGGKFKIELMAKITKCGAISPRFKVKKDEYLEWEKQLGEKIDHMVIEELDIPLENKVSQAHQMKKDMVEVQDGVRDVVAMYQSKNMT